jgi:hypothetical protein
MSGIPDRELRLIDMAPHDTIVMRCQCGRVVEYLYGYLQRHYRVPSSTLIFDMQFRFRCRQCNGRRRFQISLVDERQRGMPGAGERIIVPF